MHALICQGNGKYYVSAVFGYYRDVTATDEEERRHEAFYKPYWIVWDEKRERLIRWQTVVPNTGYLIPQILIVDAERSNWVTDGDGAGCVDFLSRELLDSFLDVEKQPEEILGKCRRMDLGYVYDDTPEIRSQQDVENLMWASSCFPDARSAEEAGQHRTIRGPREPWVEPVRPRSDRPPSKAA